MIAVLSATEHDFYAMPLPFVVYSWNKIGVKCIVFIPKGNNPKIELAKKYCGTGAVFLSLIAKKKGYQRIVKWLDFLQQLYLFLI